MYDFVDSKGDLLLRSRGRIPSILMFKRLTESYAHASQVFVGHFIVIVAYEKGNYEWPKLISCRAFDKPFLDREGADIRPDSRSWERNRNMRLAQLGRVQLGLKNTPAHQELRQELEAELRFYLQA